MNIQPLRLQLLAGCHTPIRVSCPCQNGYFFLRQLAGNFKPDTFVGTGNQRHFFIRFTHGEFSF